MTTIRFGEIEIGTQFTFAGVSLRKTDDYNAITTGERNKRVWQFSKSNRVQFTQSGHWVSPGVKMTEVEVDFSEVIHSTESNWRFFLAVVRGHITEYYIDGKKYAETAGTLGQTAGKRIIRFPDFLVEGKTISGLEVRFTQSHCQVVLGERELTSFRTQHDQTQTKDFTVEFFCNFDNLDQSTLLNMWV